MQETKPNNGGNPFNAVALSQQQLKRLSGHEERALASKHIRALTEFGYAIVEGVLSHACMFLWTYWTDVCVCVHVCMCVCVCVRMGVCMYVCV